MMLTPWYSMLLKRIMPQVPLLAPSIDAAIGTIRPSELNVSRTGYHEKDVIDPKTKNIKLSGAIALQDSPTKLKHS